MIYFQLIHIPKFFSSPAYLNRQITPSSIHGGLCFHLSDNIRSIETAYSMQSRIPARPPNK